MFATPARASQITYKPETTQLQTWKFFGKRSKEFHYDSKMLQAAEIAAKRATSKSRMYCWRYVKKALVESKIINSYPKTQYAKDAGKDLQEHYTFKKINITDPYKAPIGSVLVYSSGKMGHVEMRTKDGFASDFISSKPFAKPLTGVYVKFGN